jgi:hypothetical protein
MIGYVLGKKFKSHLAKKSKNTKGWVHRNKGKKKWRF